MADSEVPSEIINKIFSRMPIKSLFRFRSASKAWCSYIDDPYLAINHVKQPKDEPKPIMFVSRPEQPHMLRFLRINKTKDSLEAEKNVVMDDWCDHFLSRYPWVHGSCNGLLYLSEKDYDQGTTFTVINPSRKECYELPPIDISLGNEFCARESCGLGFDPSTNTFKMVCVLLKEETWSENLDEVRENLRTMVHVLGTEYSWKEIPAIPDYPIAGEAVYSQGYLYWVSANPLEWSTADPRKVICFDVKKEKFSVINHPKGISTRADNRLVDLHGEVGYIVHNIGESMEVWILKMKEWVIYARFEQKPPCPPGEMYVLGCWNKEGDILMANESKTRLFVYSRESGGVREVDVVRGENEQGEDIRMYQSSLSRIYGNNEE